MTPPTFDQVLAMTRAFRTALEAAPDIASQRAVVENTATAAPANVAVVPAHAGDVPGEWLVPRDADPARRVLYLHGGGYVSGSPRTHRALAARIARVAGAVVYVPDYALAPERPHPAALLDALAALRWVFDTGPAGPAPSHRVALAGDSAGGGLTLATLLAARERGVSQPRAAATLSAWTDLTGSGASVASRADADPMLTPALGAQWRDAYAGHADLASPLVSPLFGDLRGLPPLLMHVGDAEILLDDTTRFAARARDAGVDVTLTMWPQMFHVFQAFSPVVPAGRQAIDELGVFLRRHTEP